MKLESIILAGLILITSCDSNDGGDPIDPIKIKSRVAVKALVGGVLYEDVSATVIVQGFTSDEELKWSKEFAYAGVDSPDEIEIEGGFDHYVLTARIWGAEDSQTISAQQLFEERADGPTATTYVFAPEAEAPKLKSIISALETDIDGTFILIPTRKEEFVWSENKLVEIRDYDYSGETETFEYARYFTLTYEGGKVTRIEGFQVESDELYIETTYKYLPNGNVSQIKEINHGAGYSTQGDFTYDYDQKLVIAQYTASNGTQFTYKFSTERKNQTWDQVSKGATVCSEGNYQFDQGINPYRHLGYMDLLMGFYSINNKTVEDVDYIACSFPQMWVESHEYTYNEKGFPLTKTSTFSDGRIGTEVYTY